VTSIVPRHILHVCKLQLGQERDFRSNVRDFIYNGSETTDPREKFTFGCIEVEDLDGNELLRVLVDSTQVSLIQLLQQTLCRQSRTSQLQSSRASDKDCPLRTAPDVEQIVRTGKCPSRNPNSRGAASI